MSAYGKGHYGDGAYGDIPGPPIWLHYPTLAQFVATDDLAAINPAVPTVAAINPAVPVSAEVAAHESQAAVAGSATLAQVAADGVRADVQDVETLAEVA